MMPDRFNAYNPVSRQNVGDNTRTYRVGATERRVGTTGAIEIVT